MSGPRETETAILEMWDGPYGSAAIAACLNLRERYVLDVISRFTAPDSWQAAARASTKRLGDAIAATGRVFA